MLSMFGALLLVAADVAEPRIFPRPIPASCQFSGGDETAFGRAEAPPGGLWWMTAFSDDVGSLQTAEHLFAGAPTPRAALEDLAWSLVNAKEFVLRR